MPPEIALFVTVAFITFLFLRERKTKVNVSNALWIPLIWLLIIGSRNPSEWLGFGGATDLADGSLLDGGVFLSLQLAGMYVLFRRHVSASALISRNGVMVMFLVYGALSILWSDFPFVSLKRWVKVLEHPIMVLIVATEADPRQALIRLMKRSAYVLLPISVMLIKYYPELGRGFSEWTGEALNNGVATTKNGLGTICFLFGLFFVWHTIGLVHSKPSIERKRELILCAFFLSMLCWLISMANSATSLIALIVGVFSMLLLGARSLDRKRVSAYVAGCALLVVVVDLIFGVSDTLIIALGRDATLTGRTALWHDVLKIGINPIVGAGFESFWLGSRLESLTQKHPWHPNQAHNGYLETYLNLGLIGVLLLLAWIISAFRKANSAVLSDFHFGRLRMALVLSVAIYNYTEASFKTLHPLWFAFYLAYLDYSTKTRPLLIASQLSSQVPRNAASSSRHRAVAESPSRESSPGGPRHPALKRATTSRAFWRR